MAITNLSDFKIYDEQFQGGMIEMLTQYDQVFNDGSAGTIRLVTDDMLGYYKREAFFQNIGSSIVSRQDTTSNAAVTPHKLSQSELVEVKLFRKIEPTDITYNSFAEIGGDPEGEGSYILGKQVAQIITLEMLNGVLKALVAAVPSTLTNDQSAATPGTIDFAMILDTIAKFGDNHSRVKAFVMHSKNWFDIQKQGLTDGFENIVNGILTAHYVPFFNRPVIVTDSASLLVAGSPNTYRVLGLTDNAATLSKIGDVRMAAQQVLGQEQLVWRTQGEYRYNISLKGFAYDTANGGINPDATALATASNWDKAVASDYDTAGVLLKCK